MAENDEITSAHINFGDGTTHLVGATYVPGPFSGKVIFQVGPYSGEQPPFRPPGNLGGILGIGLRNGTGIRGIGGERELGSGPGLGVEAHGGRIKLRQSENRRLHGSGVVAAAGGFVPANNPQVDVFEPPQHVGVFGQGGAQVEENRNVGVGANFKVGPEFPGPGVVGRGGAIFSNTEPGLPLKKQEGGSAGIVGIAGGASIPPPDAFKDVNHGVVGLGEKKNQAGVYGKSDKDRGAIFESGKKQTEAEELEQPQFQAQVRLLPHALKVMAPDTLLQPARVIPPEPDFLMLLPKDGQPGDLLATDTRDQNDPTIKHGCTLWLCVDRETDPQSGDERAMWQQVLLAPTRHPGIMQIQD